LPAFDCGGFYTRGLLLQYLAALLNRLGVASETAPRLISAVSSLLALPAVFIVGRRVHGPTVGWVAVGVLALSVWETEMARFGRMYAPFQAVFLWYVVYFIRRTVDRDPRAEWPMIVLTVIGTLVWEGGVLLALANFLPPFLQRRSVSLSKREWAGLLKYVALFAAAYWFIRTDFRMLGGSPALPLDYDPSAVEDVLGVANTSPSLWRAVLVHRGWLVLSAIPLAVSAAACRALWLRDTVWLRDKGDLAAIGLVAALIAALMHQFLVAGAILVLIPLFRFGSWRRLGFAGARGVYLAIGVWALFWLSFLCVVWNPTPGTVLWKTVLSFIFPLVSVPDLISQVLRPWAAAVPRLGTGLLLLLTAGFVRVLRRDEPGVSDERAILALFVCLLLAACASDTPRHETRYVFFLYPLAVIVAIATVGTLVDRVVALRPSAAVMTPILCLALFMLSEDFQPWHLLRIDGPASVFKRNMTPAQQDHLVIRENTPALVQWLRQRAARDGDIVVNAFQSLDFYDAKIDYYYVDRRDFNFEAYACRYGMIERWSNRPLLQSVPALAAVISATASTYVVTYSTRVGPLLTQLAPYHPRIGWSDGDLTVVAFEPRNSPGARSLPRSN
jgi:hypothetical protein